MAFTDIRLLRIYNNKPAKPSMSLYTDDIPGIVGGVTKEPNQ